MDFGNVGDSIGVAGALSFSEVYVMLAVDVVLYLSAALYFDQVQTQRATCHTLNSCCLQVIPQEHGTTQHPLFLLMPSYWFPASSTDIAKQRAYDSEAGHSEMEGIEMNSIVEQSTSDTELIESSPRTPGGDVEAATPELRGQVGIAIQGLRKVAINQEVVWS